MIPEILQDNTTLVKNHTIKTHIFCIFIRITIGLLLITKIINSFYIIYLSIIIILLFGYKYYKMLHVWKVYIRTVITYFIVLILSIIYGDKYLNVSGMLVVVDALMGLQSRHIFTELGYAFKK